MSYSQSRLDALSVQHGLDGGGYAFEELDRSHPLHDLSCVIWDNPDYSYVIGQTPKGVSGAWATVFFFRPHSVDTPWPKVFDFGGETWRLVTAGRIFDHETACACHGHPDAGPGGWHFTGDTRDDPYPDCNRCDGDGVVHVEHGDYAVYTYEEKS